MSTAIHVISAMLILIVTVLQLMVVANVRYMVIVFHYSTVKITCDLFYIHDLRFWHFLAVLLFILSKRSVYNTALFNGYVICGKAT